MRYHKIEVDESVWGYLKSKAEPFEDTPNSVLNRILFGGSEQKNSTTKLTSDENRGLVLPPGIPKALSQILEVIYEVKNSNRSRTEATNIVARRRGTAPQTIIDKYCRQLSKRAYEIDELLAEQNLNEFGSLLLGKFPKYKETVTIFFDDLLNREIPNSTVGKETEDQETQPYEVKKMYALKELESLNLGKNTRPYQLELDGESFEVDNWTDLSIRFIKQLIEKNLLTTSSIPIFNYSDTRQKYFINSEPEHAYPNMDAVWKKAGGFFVDTKYNARDHVRNIIHTLEHLRILDIDFGISLRS